MHLGQSVTLVTLFLIVTLHLGPVTPLPFSSSELSHPSDLMVSRMRRFMMADDSGDDKNDTEGDGKKDEEEKKAPVAEEDPVDDDLKSDEEDGGSEDDADQDKKDDDVDNGPDVDDNNDEVKSQADSKLLIILLDGFRFDYVKRDPELKGFARMIKGGVHAKKVRPVHPSNSYPNHLSIVTGLYPEHHGFVDNYFRDRPTGEVFLGEPNPVASQPKWWMHTEPLWVTAQKHRVKSAVFGWVGCGVQGANRKKRPPPTICEPYQHYQGRKEKDIFRTRLERVVTDFKNHKYRLAMVYYEVIDHVGHKYGPQSKVTKQAVRDVDEILYDLQDMLIKNDLHDEVNVYIVSDHGMISSKQIKDIELSELIDMNDVELVLGGGTSVQVLPERNKYTEIYNRLRQANVRGLNVYFKSEVPERFHLRGHRNLLPIYLTTDRGYFIDTPDIKHKVIPDDYENDDDDDDIKYRGIHGYDAEYVEEMNGIMYAFGPDIDDAEVIEEMNQVDHYQVFCELLSIPARPNNGSQEVLKKMLTKFDAESEESDEDGDSGEKDKDDKDGDDDDDDDDDDDNVDDNSARPLVATVIQLVLISIAFQVVFVV